MVKIFLILLSFIQSSSLQELPHGFTNEELKNLDIISTMGRDTDPPPGPVRNIAEFERMEGVLIRYPFGISTSIISELSETKLSCNLCFFIQYDSSSSNFSLMF